jgi:Ca2+/Na+ antiporter
MKTTGIIWVAYLLFTKQNIEFTAVSVALLFATYVIDTFVSYYKTKKESATKEENIPTLDKKIENIPKLDKKINILTKIRTVSFYASIMIIIIGFIYYIYDKYIEYGNNFNPLTFILGKTQCNSLK